MEKNTITKRLHQTISFARTLRANQTQMEKIIWQKLRARRFHNLKFRRQVAIGPYIVDFYCADHKLVIEVDGGIHVLQQTYDRDREIYLCKCGYKVIRITNRFIREWTVETLEKIWRAVGISYD